MRDVLIVRSWSLFASLAFVFLSITHYSCKSKQGQQGSAPPPVPVIVAAAEQKSVPVHLHAIGNVEAYSSVAVKAQVGGVLTRVHFIEGQDVNKGDLLFTIDPRPSEALVKQAEANLAKSMAQLENARQEAKRYEELIKKGYVAQSQYEQIRTAADALDATVRADKATLENAQLQLSYCFIYAPIAGRTGSLIVHEGNLVKANADSPMVVVNQIQPIFVSFSVPERYLGEIKSYMARGKVKVEALAAGDAKATEGILSFVDNTVDQSTGTIRMKGTFDNGERKLWPGQFVDVALMLTTITNAVVVPSQALQAGQQGQFVYVIKDDSTAEARQVTPGQSFEGETVVVRGLQPGEKVVTDGQMRITPGAKVELKSALAPKGPKTP